MSSLAILGLVIAAGGMILGLSKQKAGVGWGRPLAIICALLALVCALGGIFTGGNGESSTQSTVYPRFQEVRGEKLGIYLAEKHAGAKAILLIEPTAPGATPRVSRVVKGLKWGLGDTVTIVAEVAPKIPGAAQIATMSEAQPMPDAAGGGQAGAAALPPFEFWFTAELFDGIVNEYKDKCDLIITTIGLPLDQQNMKFWTMEDRPKLAMAKGSVHELRGAIEDSTIVAAVAFDPDAVIRDPDESGRTSKRLIMLGVIAIGGVILGLTQLSVGARWGRPLAIACALVATLCMLGAIFRSTRSRPEYPPSDPDEMFSILCLLVTPENIASVAAEHPALFKQ